MNCRQLVPDMGHYNQPFAEAETDEGTGIRPGSESGAFPNLPPRRLLYFR